MRSALVNATALARFAKKIDLGSSLALGRGARTSGEREGLNVLADAVEALVAAVYDALGLEGARKLTLAIVEDPLAELGSAKALDPKSALARTRASARRAHADVSRRAAAKGPRTIRGSSSRCSSANACSRKAKVRARKPRSARPRRKRSRRKTMSAEWILQGYAYDPESARRVRGLEEARAREEDRARREGAA